MKNGRNIETLGPFNTLEEKIQALVALDTFFHTVALVIEVCGLGALFSKTIGTDLVDALVVYKPSEDQS